MAPLSQNWLTMMCIAAILACNLVDAECRIPDILRATWAYDEPDTFLHVNSTSMMNYGKCYHNIDRYRGSDLPTYFLARTEGTDVYLSIIMFVDNVLSKKEISVTRFKEIHKHQFISGALNLNEVGTWGIPQRTTGKWKHLFKVGKERVRCPFDGPFSIVNSLQETIWKENDADASACSGKSDTSTGILSPDSKSFQLTIQICQRLDIFVFDCLGPSSDGIHLIKLVKDHRNRFLPAAWKSGFRCLKFGKESDNIHNVEMDSEGCGESSKRSSDSVSFSFKYTAPSALTPCRFPQQAMARVWQSLDTKNETTFSSDTIVHKSNNHVSLSGLCMKKTEISKAGNSNAIDQVLHVTEWKSRESTIEQGFVCLRIIPATSRVIELQMGKVVAKAAVNSELSFICDANDQFNPDTADINTLIATNTTSRACPSHFKNTHYQSWNGCKTKDSTLNYSCTNDQKFSVDLFCRPNRTDHYLCYDSWSESDNVHYLIARKNNQDVKQCLTYSTGGSDSNSKATKLAYHKSACHRGMIFQGVNSHTVYNITVKEMCPQTESLTGGTGSGARIIVQFVIVLFVSISSLFLSTLHFHSTELQL